MVPPLVLLREVNSESINQEVLLCALLAIVGIGLALNLPSIMAEIIYIVDTKAKDESDQLVNSAGATAQAYGLFNGAFALGTLVGPIWTGYLTRNAGFGTMGWTLALLSGITAVPVFIVMGGKRITR
jgi:MFS family permease